MANSSKHEKRARKVEALLDQVHEIDGGWDYLLDVVQRRWLQRTLREARIAKGMTQAELAQRMDIGQPTLSDMETARYPDYYISTLGRWALALDLRIRPELVEIPTEQEEQPDE